MATVSAPRPQGKPAAAPRRNQPTHFQMQFVCEAESYLIAPIPCDPSCGFLGLRFTKLRTRESYVVCYSEEGHWSCECWGWLKHGSKHGPCKHIHMAMAAQRVFCGQTYMVEGLGEQIRLQAKKEVARA